MFLKSKAYNLQRIRLDILVYPNISNQIRYYYHYIIAWNSPAWVYFIMINIVHNFLYRFHVNRGGYFPINKVFLVIIHYLEII